MGEKLEQAVQDRFGAKIDSIALDLMKGKFVVREVGQEFGNGHVETELSLIVDGAEMNLKITNVGGRL